MTPPEVPYAIASAVQWIFRPDKDRFFRPDKDTLSISLGGRTFSTSDFSDLVQQSSALSLFSGSVHSTLRPPSSSQAVQASNHHRNRKRAVFVKSRGVYYHQPRVITLLANCISRDYSTKTQGKRRTTGACLQLRNNAGGLHRPGPNGLPHGQKPYQK